MAAFGSCAALRERERSGEGQLVDVSMFDGALSWLAFVAAGYLCDGVVRERGEGQLSGGIVLLTPYACRDGWVTLGEVEPKFWQEWCRGVGREDLIESNRAPGRGARRGRARLPQARTAPSGPSSPSGTTAASSPSSTSARRSTPSSSGRAEMVVSMTRRAPMVRGCSACRSSFRARRGAPPARAGARRAPRAEVLAALGYGTEEIEVLEETGAVAGPSSGTRGSFLA